MTRFEIIVKINDTSYYLDTTDSEGISINYSISDITDIAARNTSFTKTINLPETKNNREVFGFISDLSSDGSLYNPNKRSKVYLLSDSVVVMDGYLQLKKVIPDLNNNVTKYECVVYADNYTFFNLINGKYLTDIDFSEYEHTYTTQSIIGSWTSDSDLGYFYPLIDSGSGWEYKDLNGVRSELKINNFIPATYVKTIVDKMFNNVGFGYQSNFFESDKFKNLLIPFNNNVVPTSKQFIFNSSFAVGRTQSYTYSYTPSLLVGSSNAYVFAPDVTLTPRYLHTIPFNNKSTPYSDPLNAYAINYPPSATGSYWENKSGIDLSTGFVIDLDLNLEYTPYITSEAQIGIMDSTGKQTGTDYQDYISIYRNMDPVTGWVDPNFDDEGQDFPEVSDTTGLFFSITTNGGTASLKYTGNPQPRIKLSVDTNGTMSFVLETTINNTTWTPTVFKKTDGLTASSVSLTGQNSQEYYLYNLASNVKNVRIRTTSFSAGSTLLGAFYQASIGPKYDVPIFNGSTKLNLWGGQSVITTTGTFSKNGFTSSNSNFRLVRYQTDLLNNTIPSLKEARQGERFKLILTRCFKGIQRSPRRTLAKNQLAGANIVTTIGTASYMALNINQAAFPGVDIDFNGIIPKKVKQTDFMLSLMRMFNLYFEPSKDLPNTLIIEPRDDYYASGEIEDWTRKIDLNVQISEQIIAETQNKYTQFLYKSDDDWYNSDYTSKTNNIFGEYDYIMDNDFIKGTKKIELLFSPTPMTNVMDAYGIIIPKILKISNTTTGDGVAQHYDFNTRILTRNNTGLISAGGNIIRFEGASYSYYPYAGHLDNPINPTYDLNFGEITSIYDGGAFGWDHYTIPLVNDNLFNTYYAKMLDEYSNPSSKIVSLSMYLTPVDVANFRFNKSIYLDIDGVGQYYKVLNIDNYDPTTNGSTCKVTLLKTNYITIPKNVNSDDGGSYGEGTPIYIPPYQILTGLLSDGSSTTRDKNALILGPSNVSGVSSFIIGKKNISSSQNSLISGDYNNIYDSSNIITSGNNNNISQSIDGLLNIGNNNTSLNGSKGFIIGSTNSMTDSGNAFIFGDYNTASRGTKPSFIFGQGNIIGSNDIEPDVIGATDSAIYDINPRNSQGIIFGDYNTIGTYSNDGTYSNNIIFGDYNNIDSNITGSFVIGNNVIATQSNTIYIGGSSSTIIINGTVSNLTYIENTYSEISALISSNGLSIGVTYKITDRGDRGLFFIAISNNELSKIGQRLMLCPTNYTPGIYGGIYQKGVWYSGLTASANQLAIWGGQVWRNNAGVSGSPTSILALDSNWTLVDKNTFSNGEYEQKQFTILYDFNNDWIQKQWDGYGNEVGINNIYDNTFIVQTSVFYNPCDITDWNLSKVLTFNISGTYSSMSENKCKLGIFNNTSLPAISDRIIMYNNNCDIIYNNVTSKITNNHNRAIYKNVVWIIDYNTNTEYISENTNGYGSRQIRYNSNNGYIRSNSNPGDISFNSNSGVILNNSNSGDIQNNINNGAIVDNTNNGDIIYNINNGIIFNNDNNGDISNNINNGNIDNITSGTGTVSDPTVNK